MCLSYGLFLADCPNWRVLTIRKIEDLDHREVEEDEEELQEEGEASYYPPEEGNMLTINVALHTSNTL